MYIVRDGKTDHGLGCPPNGLEGPVPEGPRCLQLVPVNSYPNSRQRYSRVAVRLHAVNSPKREAGQGTGIRVSTMCRTSGAGFEPTYPPIVSRPYIFP